MPTLKFDRTHIFERYRSPHSCLLRRERQGLHKWLPQWFCARRVGSYAAIDAVGECEPYMDVLSLKVGDNIFALSLHKHD